MLRIRKQQMDILSDYMKRSFEVRMLNQIKNDFQDKFSNVTDAAISEFIQYALSRSAEYGIVSEHDVERFI